MEFIHEDIGRNMQGTEILLKKTHLLKVIYLVYSSTSSNYDDQG